MGACTGCTNPERRLKVKKQYRQGQRNRFSYLAARQSKYTESNNPNLYQSDAKFQTAPKSTYKQDPWKSRITSKVVKKYNKQPTLREQQHKTDHNIFEALPTLGPQRLTRIPSLEQSTIPRMNSNVRDNKFGRNPNTINQSYYESDSFKQFIFDKAFQNKGTRNYNSNNAGESSPIQQYYKGVDLDYQLQRNNYYLPKKMDRLRDRQLAEIMQTFQLEAQTPGYVKQLRKNKGQDIKMNNFQKFQAIPNFEWFSLGKYIEQIQNVQQTSELEKNRNKNKSNPVNNSSNGKLRKQPILIQIEQSPKNQINSQKVIEVN